MRRIVQLDSDDWAKRCVANHKIDMFRTNAPEVCQSQAMAFVGLD
jgi:hypothetical protein